MSKDQDRTLGEHVCKMQMKQGPGGAEDGHHVASQCEASLQTPPTPAGSYGACLGARGKSRSSHTRDPAQSSAPPWIC